MTTSNFQPPPTYALPIETDPVTGKATFNRVWLKWFYDLVQALNNAQVTGGTIQHNLLAGLQGGQANEYYHLTATEHDRVSNFVYGSMYANNVSQTITIAATSTYYDVPGSLSGGTSSGVTFQNAKELLIGTAGKYFCSWHMFISPAVGSNQDIEGTVGVNGTANLTMTAHSLATTGTGTASLGGSGVLTLAANDLVRLMAANVTATNNLTLNHASLLLFRVSA